MDSLFWITTAIASALGILSGLGVGGGSLLMIVLTAFMGCTLTQARILNLLFFLPAACIASLYHRCRGKLRGTALTPAIGSGVLSAAVMNILSGFVNTALLQKIFGFILLIVGIRELFYRERKAR